MVSVMNPAVKHFLDRGAPSPGMDRYSPVLLSLVSVTSKTRCLPLYAAPISQAAPMLRCSSRPQARGPASWSLLVFRSGKAGRLSIHHARGCPPHEPFGTLPGRGRTEGGGGPDRPACNPVPVKPQIKQTIQTH